MNIMQKLTIDDLIQASINNGTITISQFLELIKLDNDEQKIHKLSIYLNPEKELEKCKNDIVYFVENYMTINNEPMVLRDYEKEFLCKYNDQMNNEQIKFILTGLRMGDMFRKRTHTNLSTFIKAFPKKKDNQLFEWNLQNMKKDAKKK